MKKKNLLAFILTAVIAIGAFAQDDFESMPKNTAVVDFGPTIVGISIAQMGKIISDNSSGVNSSGFGIAGQYERQLMPNFAVAGKIGYLGGGIVVSDSFEDVYSTVETSLGIDFSSFTIEAHARYYPFAKTFFLDGMLGYANLTTTCKGEVVGYDDGTDKNYAETVSFTATRNYINLGAKLGWRINFGRQGGFTFEPSLGYYYALGFGNTMGKQLLNHVEKNVDIGSIDYMFSLLENYVFIGGLRIALAFGWRF